MYAGTSADVLFCLDQYQSGGDWGSHFSPGQSAGRRRFIFILFYEEDAGPLAPVGVDIPEEVDIPEDATPDGVEPEEAARGTWILKKLFAKIVLMLQYSRN